MFWRDFLLRVVKDMLSPFKFRTPLGFGGSFYTMVLYFYFFENITTCNELPYGFPHAQVELHNSRMNTILIKRYLPYYLVTKAKQ